MKEFENQETNNELMRQKKVARVFKAWNDYSKNPEKDVIETDVEAEYDSECFVEEFESEVEELVVEFRRVIFRFFTIFFVV